MEILRHVQLDTGHTLKTWENPKRASTGQSLLGYEFATPSGLVLFTGEDFGCSPVYSIDSDDSLRSLLSFLTLRPGDTDREYFEGYTAAQLAFAQSSDAETLKCFYTLEPEGDTEQEKFRDIY